MTLENWTLTSLDEFSSLDDAVQELCRPHVNYLEQLKAYYRQTTLEIPHVWIFGEESVTYRTCIWTETNWFNAELLRTQLRCVQEDLAFLTDEQIIGRLLSPDPAKPVNFCRSTERHYQDFYGHSVTDNEDTTVCKTHMTLCQVAQVLQYDGNSELLAEHAIAIMFDGIPGAYVRRQNLGVMGLRQGDLEDPVGPIDCAVLSVPVEPSTPRSLEQLSGLPISAVNPALLLCAKGPARWLKSAEPQSGAPNEELTATLVRIARLAETSLASLVALGTPAASSTRDDAHSEAGGTMAPTAGTRTSEAVELGDCPLMTMALVYDSERVLLVAHIPYAAQDVADGRKYLSLVFDTLPFASRCSDRSIRQFIRQRYQVALALLSVQQHVLRMAAYMERCSWPMHVGTLTPTEPSVVAELATSHGFIPEAVANPEAVCAQSTEVVQAWSQETRSPEDIRGAPQQSQVAIESSDGLREQPTGPFAVINADVEGTPTKIPESICKLIYPQEAHLRTLIGDMTADVQWEYKHRLEDRPQDQDSWYTLSQYYKPLTRKYMNTQFWRGDVAPIPVSPNYSAEVWFFVNAQFMKTPEFLRYWPMWLYERVDVFQVFSYITQHIETCMLGPRYSIGRTRNV